MGVSRFDLLYRRLILTKFYTRGWGNPQHMKEIMTIHKMLSDRELCYDLVSPDYPVHIDKQQKCDNYTLLNGHFVTPFMTLAPDIVPKESRIARFQMLIPDEKEGRNEFGDLRPACLHMAGTGDHGFARRRELMAKPLLKHGISSVLLENPFYGSRKPKAQFRSGLLHVNDLFVMGSCLIMEALVIFHWLKRNGHGPLGITGISMGGHMASLAATNWPERLVIVPCMSWTSASVVWTEGVLSRSIPWRTLEKQYSENEVYETDIFNSLDNRDDQLYTTPPTTVVEPQVKRTFWFTRGKKDTPTAKQVQQQQEELDRRRRQTQTQRFMRSVMDQMTHLKNFTIPIDTSLVTFVIAKQDAYYPQHSVLPMTQVWPGCEVREIPAGHVAGFLIYHTLFTKAIVDTFHRYVRQQDGGAKIKEAGGNYQETSNKQTPNSSNWSLLNNMYKGVFAKS